MSKRTIGDYVRAAFLARDKATADAIVKDAEEAIPPPADDPDHKEPDGDEGDKHESNIHIHVAHGKSGDSVESRVAKLEDGMTKLAKSFDSFTAAIKDGELPPWLKKEDGGEEGDGEEAAPEEETKDVGSDPSDGETETGALTMEKLGEAEPELMNADPSKKTGEMMGTTVGDKAYVERMGKGIAKLAKDIRARSEILSPGIKFGTFDATPTAATVKTLCNMRRKALTSALSNPVGKQAVGSFDAAALKGMSCTLVRTLFHDASERMKAHNNAGGHHSIMASDEVFVANATQVERLKQINASNKDFWARQTGAIRH